ncbi:hypothetical protein ACFQX6_50745 [Streptosporangium lutulentum]
MPIWSRSGSSSSTSASRTSSRAAATSALRLSGNACRAPARSAARIASKVTSRFAAPWSFCTAPKPRTSAQSTILGAGRRRSPMPDVPLTSATLVITHSARPVSFMARSRTVIGLPSSSTWRSSISPMARVSVVRCSNRRMLIRPLKTTEPASIARTRVMGRKTRRRGCTSTTRPCTRGGAVPAMDTTTSRIRPI